MTLLCLTILVVRGTVRRVVNKPRNLGAEAAHLNDNPVQVRE